MARDLLAIVLAVLTAGCTSGVCARTSDCEAGQLCTAAGRCAVPADASIDGQGGDAAATSDASAMIDAAAAALTSEPTGSP